MKKRVSIKDVASRAGVSTALVSYVLNNKKEGRISKEASEKIKQAAMELNYVPNQIARSLKVQKTNTIGLIVADIANPYSSLIARFIENEAQKNGYSVIFGSSDESVGKTQDLIMLFFNRQVDGLIVALPEKAEVQLKYLKGTGIPFVLIDRYYPDFQTNTVCIDNYSAAKTAVEHLIAQGRRRIGVINYETNLHHLLERERGALDTVVDNELLQRVRLDYIQEDVETGIQKLLELPEPIDSLFFTTNLLTISGLKYFIKKNIKIPNKLSIVGFDETDAFDIFSSPVSYVKQPMEDLANQAVNLLLKVMENPEETATITLQTELVIRESSMN